MRLIIQVNGSDRLMASLLPPGHNGLSGFPSGFRGAIGREFHDQGLNHGLGCPAVPDARVLVDDSRRILYRLLVTDYIAFTVITVIIISLSGNIVDAAGSRAN
jgi:hypothetical protein